MTPPESILLIKPGSLGDVIHALPVASALHAAWPESRITWIVDPRWQPLLQHHPAIATTRPFPRQTFRGLLGGIRGLRWLCDLRGMQPDLALDLQGLFRSGLICHFSQARKSCGLSDSREFARLFHDVRVSVDPNAHAVDRYFSTIEALGLPQNLEKVFTISCDRELVNNSHSETYVAVHPFARGAGKALADQCVSALIAELAKCVNIPIKVVGFGTFAPDWGREGVEDWTNRTTLPELVQLLRGSRFVVSADSGPMHLAAALERPLLGIHTWSDPRKVGPYGNAWIWQGGEIRRQDLQSAPRAEKPFTEEDARAVARFVAAQMH